MSLRELGVALVQFAAEGDVENVRKRIKAGASPDYVTDTRTPALSWAVTNGHVEVVKVLLSAGAQANLADLGGMNALHCGGRVGNLEATKLLLSARALINAQTYIDGFTALLRPLRRERERRGVSGDGRGREGARATGPARSASR